MNDNIPAKEHDSTFKFLFEDPKDILFLVRDVIGYKWANQIQMDSIEIVPNEFVDEQFLRGKGKV